MFTGAFGSYSINDVVAAKQFYGEVLGIETMDNMGGVNFEVGGQRLFLYPKEDHQPASFTVLNFMVDDINATVDELAGRGVAFMRYDNLPAQQDERGILRGGPIEAGPDIAWFEDPAGNILALIQTEEK